MSQDLCENLHRSYGLVSRRYAYCDIIALLVKRMKKSTIAFFTSGTVSRQLILSLNSGAAIQSLCVPQRCLRDFAQTNSLAEKFNHVP